MKHIFSLLFILPFLAQAQDCKIKKEVDPFSQQPKLTTGFIPFGAGINRILLSIDANNKEIDYFFTLKTAGDAKCFDNNSTATLLFEGGRLKSNFKNTGTMNCEGLFHFTFKNSTTTPSILQRLATKKILSIQFTDTNGKVTNVDLKEEEQQALINLTTCMINEAKSLVK